MKKFKRVILLCTGLALMFGIVGCDKLSKSANENKNILIYSNLAGENSLNEVESLLLANLNKNSVDNFIKTVKEYNEITGSAGLKGEFTEFITPEYDIDKISSLWTEKKGDFIGTNCRINSYMLLKNNIVIPQVEMDDRLLFLDNDAIEMGKIFNEEERRDFQILFSRVKTEATEDIAVHAKNMENYFSKIKFNDKARMISVVLHDNLEGDYLFIGHVGILVPDKDRFLFIEKLSFEEPYQAIKFTTKEECYKYLQGKYAGYTGEGLAKPFIMDNNKWIK